MSHPRPRVCVPWFLTFVLAVLAAMTGPVRCYAFDDGSRLMPVYKPVSSPAGAGAGSSVANSNCGGAACDTVWIGHSNSGPGGGRIQPRATPSIMQ